MKTPDDIKKGLKCSDCKNCPYSEFNTEDKEDHCSDVDIDAIAYIQQLEKELAELRLLKSWDDFPERMGR